MEEELIKKTDGEWNRTTDLGLMSPLLYRLSYAVVETLNLGNGWNHDCLTLSRYQRLRLMFNRRVSP